LIARVNRVERSPGMLDRALLPVLATCDQRLAAAAAAQGFMLADGQRAATSRGCR